MIAAADSTADNSSEKTTVIISVVVAIVVFSVLLVAIYFKLRLAPVKKAMIRKLSREEYNGKFGSTNREQRGDEFDDTSFRVAI